MLHLSVSGYSQPEPHTTQYSIPCAPLSLQVEVRELCSNTDLFIDHNSAINFFMLFFTCSTRDISTEAGIVPPQGDFIQNSYDNALKPWQKPPEAANLKAEMVQK